MHFIKKNNKIKQTNRCKQHSGWSSKLIAIRTHKLSYIKVYTSPWSRFELTRSVVTGTDCIGCCKLNYHTITPTTCYVRLYKFVILYRLLHNNHARCTQSVCTWCMQCRETNEPLKYLVCQIKLFVAALYL